MPRLTCARRRTTTMQALEVSSLAPFWECDVCFADPKRWRLSSIQANKSFAAGRIPMILGYGALTSITLSVFELTGGSLRGKKPEIEGMDEFERKDYLRTNRRGPIENTIQNLGEGRGKHFFPWYIVIQLLTQVLAYRNQRTRLRTAATRDTEGEVRCRDQPRFCPGVLEETAPARRLVHYRTFLRPTCKGELTMTG